MLQRLFSRGVPEHRVKDALERDSDFEQQSVLRERSAVILDRLERKKIVARRAMLAREAEAREAAELARKQELEDAAHGVAVPPMDGVDAAEARDAVEPEAVTDPAAEGAGPRVAVGHEGTDAGSLASEAPGTAETIADDMPQDARPGLAPEPAEAAELFTESEPLRADAPAMTTAEEPFYRVEEGEPVSGTPAEAETEAGTAAVANEAVESDEAPRATESADNEEAYELLRKKAEEARARIAARIEKLEADSGADSGDGRIELGPDAPPIFHDDTEN